MAKNTYFFIACTQLKGHYIQEKRSGKKKREEHQCYPNTNTYNREAQDLCIVITCQVKWEFSL